MGFMSSLFLRRLFPSRLRFTGDQLAMLLVLVACCFPVFFPPSVSDDDEEEEEDFVREGVRPEPLPPDKAGDKQQQQGNGNGRQDLGEQQSWNSNDDEQQDSNSPLVDGDETASGAETPEGAEQLSGGEHRTMNSSGVLDIASLAAKLRNLASETEHQRPENEHEGDCGDEIEMIENFNSPVFDPSLRLPPSHFAGESSAKGGQETAPGAETLVGAAQPGGGDLPTTNSSGVFDPPSLIGKLQTPTAETEQQRPENKQAAASDDEIVLIPNSNSPVFSPTSRLPPSYFAGESSARGGQETAPESETPEEAEQPDWFTSTVTHQRTRNPRRGNRAA